MTYWVTLWYAGIVVAQIGYEGQTYSQCESLKRVVEADITAAYANPEAIDELAKSMFPTNEFNVTCESKMYTAE